MTCGIPDDKDVLVLLRLKGLVVRGNEVEFVSQTTSVDGFAPHVGGDGHEDVEWNLDLIPGNDGLVLIVHPGNVEFRRQPDVLLVQADAPPDAFYEQADARGFVNAPGRGVTK